MHMMSRIQSLFFAAAGVVMLVGCSTAVSSAPAAPPLNPGSVWTVRADGPAQSVQNQNAEGRLDYSVSWSVLKLDPGMGETSATISGTAYLAECDCDRSKRPVMFLFNGGPGASSSPLHFSMGPKSRSKDGDFPDNPYTLLREADLVFVDPVDTGFSRSGSDAGVDRYLGVEGDVSAVDRFIRAWLEGNDREEAPILLAGQSYGGTRLAYLLGKVGDLDVRGLIMVSPALDSGAGQTDLGHVFALPTMAATAWRFGKSSIEAATEAAAWEAARSYAEGDYLLALQQGDRLGIQEKARIADQIAAMTGMTPEAVIAADLRVDIQFFLENLLAEDGRLVSRLNTAITSPLPSPDTNAHRPAAANDPSLGLGRSNIILSSEIATYLADVTGHDLGTEYRSLNLDANFAWDWRSSSKSPNFYVSSAPMLSRFMNEKPTVILMVLAGYRDLATTLLGTDYALTHNGLPQDRVELVALPAGHSPYDEEGLKAEIAQRLIKFIKAATRPALAPSQESPQ